MEQMGQIAVKGTKILNAFQDDHYDVKDKVVIAYEINVRENCGVKVCVSVVDDSDGGMVFSECTLLIQELENVSALEDIVQILKKIIDGKIGF